MFLLPDINLRLRPRLLNLKPGTRIVSNSFTMEEWEADNTITLESGCSTWCTAFLWIIPAKVEGKWRLGEGELTITQQFQKISGSLAANGKNTSITGKLTGDQINFGADGAEYSGRVNGDAISGVVKSGAGNSNWQATREK
jgi:hypothetical protein